MQTTTDFQKLYRNKELKFEMCCFPINTLPNYSVGKDGFEPPNSEEDRFTVCCRWPLGYLPLINDCSLKTVPYIVAIKAKPFRFIVGKISKARSQWRDSNPRPADYKSAALAN